MTDAKSPKHETTNEVESQPPSSREVIARRMVAEILLGVKEIESLDPTAKTGLYLAGVEDAANQIHPTKLAVIHGQVRDHLRDLKRSRVSIARDWAVCHPEIVFAAITAVALITFVAW